MPLKASLKAYFLFLFSFVKHNLWLFAIAGTVFFSACKKDDKDSGDNTKLGLLTKSSWKLVSRTISPAIDWAGDGHLYTDLLAAVPCAADDITTFKKEGVVDFDDGPVSCGGNQLSTAKWDFTINETAITLRTEDEQATSTILELSETRLRISYVLNVRDDAGVETKYTVEETFVH